MSLQLKIGIPEKKQSKTMPFNQGDTVADARNVAQLLSLGAGKGARLRLSAEEVTALEARTEGWIAGLQLAALSLQGQHDASAFIASFTGSHHFVLGLSGGRSSAPTARRHPEFFAAHLHPRPAVRPAL